MKRLLSALFALLLLLPTLALASDKDVLVDGNLFGTDKLRVLHRSCTFFKNGGDDCVYVFYELQNTGDNIVDIDNDKTSIIFYDAAGREIYRTNDFVIASPRAVYPGERTFLFEYLISSVDGQQNAPYAAISQAADYGLELALQDNSWGRYDGADPVYVDARATLRIENSNPLAALFGGNRHEYKLDVTVTNNTGKDLETTAWGLDTIYILRDEHNNPVLVESAHHTPFKKIRAGETITYTQTLTGRAIDMFEEYDFKPSSCETIVYIKKTYVK